MSREIKFRAWDGKFSYLKINTHSTIFSLEHVDTLPFVLEQFIGLKDRGGKEIYEGDIVEVVLNGEERRGLVKWDEQLLSFVHTINFKPCYAVLIWCVDVIGNIHENPELLQ